MTEQRAWTVRESSGRRIRLNGGPFDGALVEGPRCDTDDGLPDHIRMEPTGEVYVRGTEDEYLYRAALSPARVS